VLILFVEYHASFRQSASYMTYQEADVEVVSQAGSVAEGREKIAQCGKDTAIVDVPLPDEEVAEMVRELRDANPSVPVLVLTRAEHPEARAEFSEAGASEVHPKDCTFAQILAAVRRLGDEA
jgi:DNA-binding NarL/FixJ family response regulator